MTIKYVFEQLEGICRLSFYLLDATGFSRDEGGLGEEVCHLDDIFEDTFLRRCAEEIMSDLEHACMILYGMRRVQYEDPLDPFGYGVTCSGPEPDEDDDEPPWDEDEDDQEEELPFPLHAEDSGIEGRRTP